MALRQEVTEQYAVYQADCIEALPRLPERSVHFSVYSPPFAGDAGGLFNYSSLPNDLSNNRRMGDFFAHYEFLVREIGRVTLPGRLTAVHCMDTPGKGDSLMDFPGEVIRLHQRLGWRYHARFCIWKEPLRVAIRTRSKGLMHKQVVKDSSLCNNAGADYLLIFRNAGENAVPIAHPNGLRTYVGERELPQYFRTAEGKTLPLNVFQNGWKDPSTNKLSHWIWQQYASSFWDDIRNSRVLPYKAARDKEDEKHVHPLQLDVVERCVLMWSNLGENVLSPFMGVGSEVCGALYHGRRGIGIELKESYFKQARRNIAQVLKHGWGEDEKERKLF